MLDLSQTYGTIEHNILIDKLQCYGFRGTVKDWLTSYMSNRKQYVSINDKHSTTLPIRTGVPQEPILRHLLFTLILLMSAKMLN